MKDRHWLLRDLANGGGLGRRRAFSMATLTVGAGQEFQTIAAAVGAAQDGDVVAVQAGTYVDDFAEVTHKITLEGVGGMVNLVASGSIGNGKAMLITDTDVTIDHFAFTGATVADGNGAGIRYQGGNLVVSDSLFRDNQDGILGAADPNGTVLITDSEFDHNGAGDGYTHGIYIGDIASLVIEGSYFHDAVVGHEIKSRAEATTIRDSRIADDDGSASYAVDLPNGGAVTISGSVIEKGPNSQNPVMIAFGEEGNLHANSSLTVSGDTLLYDRAPSPSSLLVRNVGGSPAVVSGNSYFGLPASQVLGGNGVVNGNVALGNEPALDGSSPITSPITSLAGSGPVGVGVPQWADPVAAGGPDDGTTVFRFFDRQTGTQFLTSSASERNAVMASRPDLSNEGAGFGALPAGDGGSVQVFRFFDMTSGTHFYTSDAAERDGAEAMRPDLAYEGVAFNEYAGAQPGAEAVYRFFDTGQGTHFYTGSASERASILASRPDLVSEGIAFYAPTS